MLHTSSLISNNNKDSNVIQSAKPTVENIVALSERLEKCKGMYTSPIKLHDDIVGCLYELHSMIWYTAINPVHIAICYKLHTMIVDIYNHVTSEDVINYHLMNMEDVYLGNDLKYFERHYNDILHVAHTLLLDMTFNIKSRFYKMTLSNLVAMSIPSRFYPDTLKDETMKKMIDINDPKLITFIDRVCVDFGIECETLTVDGELKFKFNNLTRDRFIDISSIPMKDITLYGGALKDRVIKSLIDRYERDKELLLPFVELGIVSLDKLDKGQLRYNYGLVDIKYVRC